MRRQRHEAALLGDRLIIWDPAEGSELYKAGYFGKPVGIAKPKTAEFDVPLLLDLMEGYYLAEAKMLNVVDQFTGNRITRAHLRRYARKAIDEFDGKYEVYSNLRKKGYVVTTGIKFGCDFAVYEHGPGIDHAPYMVQVKRGAEEITATELVRAGRLATTVRKRFIIAVPTGGPGGIQYMMFRWWKA